MAKMRVHELAKALDKSSKEVLNALKLEGMDIQSHMSMVTDEQAAKVRARFNKSQAPKAQEPARKPAAAQGTAPASRPARKTETEQKSPERPAKRPEAAGEKDRRPDL